MTPDTDALVALLRRLKNEIPAEGMPNHLHIDALHKETQQFIDELSGQMQVGHVVYTRSSPAVDTSAPRTIVEDALTAAQQKPQKKVHDVLDHSEDILDMVNDRPLASGDAARTAEDSLSAAGGSPAFWRWVNEQFGDVHPGDLRRLQWAFSAGEAALPNENR